MKSARALKSAIDSDNGQAIKWMSDAVEILICHKITVSGYFPVENCEVAHPTFAQYSIIQGKYNAFEALLDIAIKSKLVKEIKIGEREKNILYLMIARGNTPVALIEKYLNHVDKSEIDAACLFGKSALHHAVRLDRRYMVRLLFEKGANPIPISINECVDTDCPLLLALTTHHAGRQTPSQMTCFDIFLDKNSKWRDDRNRKLIEILERDEIWGRCAGYKQKFINFINDSTMPLVSQTVSEELGISFVNDHALYESCD